MKSIAVSQDIRTVAATFEHAEAISHLFGRSGACGGCWYMHRRVPHEEKAWDAIKGKANHDPSFEFLKKARLQSLLALAGDEAVGWYNCGPRTHLSRVSNSRAL